MKETELRTQTCCFTGHRDLPAGQIPIIVKQTADEIRALILSKSVRFFGVGGAIGYDTLAAEVLFHLRETEFPHIKVILVYPFDGFTGNWPPKGQADYKRLLPKYDKVVRAYHKACREAYFARNRRLVDGSAYCISYCTRNCGGTFYTLRYAARQGLDVKNISGYDV